MNAKKQTDDSPGGGGGDGQLPAPKQSFSQQLLVWFLVVMVGVLFGMGPALGLITAGGPPEFANVSQAEAQRFRQIQRNLDIILYDRYRQGSWEDYARVVWQARIAEEEGLMPKGDELDRLMDDYLQQKVGERSARAILEDYRESDHAVPPGDLRWYLKHQLAFENLQTRRLVVPVTPPVAGDDLYAAARDQVVLDEVVLSVQPLIAAHREAAAADELALREAYDSLREEWFRVPAKRTVTRYLADPEAIGEQIALEDAELEAWYRENREQHPEWLAPEPEEPAGEEDADAEAAEGDDEGEAVDAEAAEAPEELEYQPLEAVREAVLAAMRHELAVPVAKRLQRRFETSLQKRLASGKLTVHDLSAEDLAEVVAESAITPEEEPRLEGPVRFTVTPEVVISQPLERSQGNAGGLIIDIPEVGAARFSQDPFDPELETGFIDLPRPPEGSDVALAVRLFERTPSSYQDFEAVREQVVEWVAGRAAWGELVDRARQIAADATVLGDQGLRSYFADEATAEWATTVEERPTAVLRRFREPPEDPDGEPGAAFLAADLIEPDLSVRVALAAPRGGDLLGSLPRVRLVQGRTYQRGGSGDEQNFLWRMMTPDRFDPLYRRALRSYQQRQYLEELQQRTREE